jgi:hypothetical protein
VKNVQWVIFLPPPVAFAVMHVVVGPRDTVTLVQFHFLDQIIREVSDEIDVCQRFEKDELSLGIDLEPDIVSVQVDLDIDDPHFQAEVIKR